MTRNCLSPKLPRDVSGESLVKVLCSKFGYVRRSQVGSHQTLELDGHGHIAIPMHNVIKIGTLANILRDFEAQTDQSRDELLKLP